MGNDDLIRQLALVNEMAAALKAALPHVERIAATAPTEPARAKRQREAAAALDLIRAALAKAEQS